MHSENRARISIRAGARTSSSRARRLPPGCTRWEVSSGRAHAFTPWTSLFAEFDRVRDCYGSEPIDFLELGLFSDTSYATGIPDLREVPFLSFSDAHSATPLKVGREFTTLAPSARTARAVIAAIAAGRIVENMGLFPDEGEYNRSACTRGYE